MLIGPKRPVLLSAFALALALCAVGCAKSEAPPSRGGAAAAAPALPGAPAAISRAARARPQPSPSRRGARSQ